ncbi:hypothetical protein ASG24_01430 [Methylophilus sp. Leaf414]|nr:hypothetical protein ASG24_01430 [Methylophilus sp. Leaf414]
MKALVQVIMLTTGSMAQFGSYSTDDKFNVSPEFALHLVNDCKAAKYATKKDQQLAEASDPEVKAKADQDAADKAAAEAKAKADQDAADKAAAEAKAKKSSNK